MRNMTHPQGALVILTATLLVVGPVGAAGPDADRAGATRMETLCHFPQGNPAHARTIGVHPRAVASHLEHGDILGECPEECAGPPAPVAKSGHADCWGLDNGLPGGLIDCAGTGQDGEYQAGVSVTPRFTDNGDGTVTDNLTGLLWLRSADCFGPQSFGGALADSNALANGQCGLSDASLAGDWRLPHVKELQSLLDFGRFDPSLPLGHPFLGAPSGDYWSSTPARFDPVSTAWLVDMDTGETFAFSTLHTSHVWPVRGGPSTYSECGDGEVTGSESCEIDEDCVAAGLAAQCVDCQCRWCGDGVLTYPEECDYSLSGEFACGLDAVCSLCTCLPGGLGDD